MKSSSLNPPSVLCRVAARPATTESHQRTGRPTNGQSATGAHRSSYDIAWRLNCIQFERHAISRSFVVGFAGGGPRPEEQPWGYRPLGVVDRPGHRADHRPVQPGGRGFLPPLSAGAARRALQGGVARRRRPGIHVRLAGLRRPGSSDAGVRGAVGLPAARRAGGGGGGQPASFRLGCEPQPFLAAGREGGARAGIPRSGRRPARGRARPSSVAKAFRRRSGDRWQDGGVQPASVHRYRSHAGRIHRPVPLRGGRRLGERERLVRRVGEPGRAREPWRTVRSGGAAKARRNP